MGVGGGLVTDSVGGLVTDSVDEHWVAPVPCGKAAGIPVTPATISGSIDNKFAATESDIIKDNK